MLTARCSGVGWGVGWSGIGDGTFIWKIIGALLCDTFTAVVGKESIYRSLADAGAVTAAVPVQL